MNTRIRQYADRFIFKLIDYLFRKKSLNFILYILVVFTITELTAIGAGEALAKLLNELQAEVNNDFLFWILRIIEAIYISGSYLALGISLFLIVIIALLRRTELSKASSGEKFKLIVDGLEKRNTETQEALDEALSEAEIESKRKEEYKKFLDKINYTLQAKNISKEELIKKISGKLKAIVLYKSFEQGDKLIRDEVYPALGVINISSGLCIIPPNKLDQHQSDKALLNWFKEEVENRIPEDYDYNFPIVAVVDLTKITAYKRLQPYRRFNRTYLDKIGIEDLISMRELESYLYTEKNISSKDVIETASIGFLIDSNIISTEDYELLKKNNDKIIAAINEEIGADGITTTQFANLKDETLNKVLSQYIDHPEEITKSIKSNAKFWKDYFSKNYK